MHAEAAISHRSSKAHCRLLPGPDSFEPGHVHHVAQFSVFWGFGEFSLENAVAAFTAALKIEQTWYATERGQYFLDKWWPNPSFIAAICWMLLVFNTY